MTEVEDLSLSVVRQFSIYMSSRGRKGSCSNGISEGDCQIKTFRN